VITAMAVDRLQRELAEIAIASRHQLIERWRRLMKRDPPRYASVEFLRFVAAYVLQERVLGGLSPKAKRQLVAIARGEKPAQATGQIRIKPGSRLLREWHGTTHEVIVTDKGFVWEGRTYKSLSAVAQAISGAKWNGPRFFGLIKERHRPHG
jgi:hypothetical protein